LLSLKKIIPPARRYLCSPALLLACLLSPWPALTQDDWQKLVQTAVHQHQVSVAMAIVNHRLSEAPDDMEAHAWHARLLAWTNHWPESEDEYRLVLEKFPNDIEVLIGLADVLLWQQKYSESLAALEQACTAAPQNSEVLVRRARVLSLLQRVPEARAQFQAVLAYDPENRYATNGLAGLAGLARYELRVGEETDFFNYTEDAHVETLAFTVRWNDKWTDSFGVSPYYLFGERAVKFWADAAYRFHQNNWVRVLAAGANPQDVVPETEALVEYGHGFRFSNFFVKGLESSWQEHSLWYRDAQVVTLNTTQTSYLPRDWMWTLSLTGARTHFPGGESDWVPSGSTKIGFPLLRKLSGSVDFAVGTENFAQVDQIGRLSARTYGGGIRYRFAESQNVSAFFARQDREHRQKQSTLGLNYGIRF
jgi:tetratricopeptide (TPR) repeat protein